VTRHHDGTRYGGDSAAESQLKGVKPISADTLTVRCLLVGRRCLLVGVQCAPISPTSSPAYPQACFGESR
jgi:hypothetical protein